MHPHTVERIWGRAARRVVVVVALVEGLVVVLAVPHAEPSVMTDRRGTAAPRIAVSHDDQAFQQALFIDCARAPALARRA